MNNYIEQFRIIANRRSWTSFLLIVCLALTIGFGSYHLTESPPTWYDEGMILQLAQNMALHGDMNLQLAPGTFVSAWHVSTGYPVVLPVALAYKIWGIGILQARSVALVFIVLLVCATFFLLRRLYNSPYALWGIFLVATFSSLYGNGKNVLGEIPGLFFLMLFLYFFKKWEDNHFVGWKYALGTGIFIGLTCATKPIFFLTLPAFAVALFLVRKKIIWNKQAIIGFTLGGLITGIAWFIFQFGPTDTIQSVLHFYANPYDANSVVSPIMANIKRFFTEATPIYTLLTFLIWTAAFIIRKVRAHSISAAEICAYGFSLLVLIAYVRLPGWYRYLFPANILILAFLPAAIRTVVHSLSNWWLVRMSPAPAQSNNSSKLVMRHASRPMQLLARFAPTILILCFFVFQSYYLFFGSWISTASAGTNSALLTEFGQQVDPNMLYFVFDSPQVVPFLRTTLYYQYFSGGGVWVAGTEYLDVLKKGLPDFVIVDGSNIPIAEPYLGQYSKQYSVGRYAVFARIVRDRSFTLGSPE